MKVRTKNRLIISAVALVVAFLWSLAVACFVNYLVHLLGDPGRVWKLIFCIFMGLWFWSNVLFKLVRKLEEFLDLYSDAQNIKAAYKQFRCKHYFREIKIVECPGFFRLLDVEVTCCDCGFKLNPTEAHNEYLIKKGYEMLYKQNTEKFPGNYKNYCEIIEKNLLERIKNDEV